MIRGQYTCYISTDGPVMSVTHDLQNIGNILAAKRLNLNDKKIGNIFVARMLNINNEKTYICSKRL